jgi:outer membrane protein OmpA-like peptidoglycan-associated protein
MNREAAFGEDGLTARDLHEMVTPRVRFLQIVFYALVGIPIAIVLVYAAVSRSNVREAQRDLLETQRVLTQSRAAAATYEQTLDLYQRYGLANAATSSPDGQAALNLRLASLDRALGRAGFEQATLGAKLDQVGYFLLDTSATPKIVGGDDFNLRSRLLLQQALIAQLRAQLSEAPHKTPHRPAPISGEPLAIIGFAFGNDVLDDAAKKEIATLASLLAARNVRSITVAGHADTVGADESNYALAERRAAAVAQALASDLKKPVPIEVVGYGERRLEQRTLDNVDSASNRAATIYAH